MHILFYFRTHFDDTSNIGVIGKCRAIVQAFSAAGFSSDTFHFSQKGLEQSGKSAPVLPWPNAKRSLRHLVLYFLLGDKWMAENIDFQSYSHLYIRHFPVHAVFLKLLKTAKKQNPGLKILIELPTWPYNLETTGFANKLVAMSDRHYRKDLHLYVDYVLHYGTDTSVLGIPAIPVSNGIDWRQIPVRTITPHAVNTLRCIAVGNWNTWHGLDRVLQGIKRYGQGQEKTMIQLTIIGSGPAVQALKKMATELQLNYVVEFHPPCAGDVLAHFFNQADVAIGVLGLHRKGLTIGSPLKHRDYCARGIPFVMAGKDSDFAPDWPYILNFPEDDSPVDMNKVIALANNFKEEDMGKMRQFAEDNLGWDAKIKTFSDRYFDAFYP